MTVAVIMIIMVEANVILVVIISEIFFVFLKGKYIVKNLN